MSHEARLIYKVGDTWEAVNDDGNRARVWLDEVHSYLQIWKYKCFNADGTEAIDESKYAYLRDKYNGWGSSKRKARSRAVFWVRNKDRSIPRFKRVLDPLQ